MSLDIWPAKFNTDEYDPNETQAVVFSLMYIDMSGITEENIQEVFIRIKMWEKQFNTFLVAVPKNNIDGETVRIPTDLKMLRKYIGIHVNVPEKSKAAFKNKLAGLMREEADRQYFKEQKELEVVDA